MVFNSTLSLKKEKLSEILFEIDNIIGFTLLDQNHLVLVIIFD